MAQIPQETFSLLAKFAGKDRFDDVRGAASAAFQRIQDFATTVKRDSVNSALLPAGDAMAG